ncbi:hypothetical protein WL74_33340 [Burkholderia cepacia]|nr:hypothetical protein WL74_33340 [Burkholderia cepacia]
MVVIASDAIYGHNASHIAQDDVSPPVAFLNARCGIRMFLSDARSFGGEYLVCLDGARYELHTSFYRLIHMLLDID